MINSEIAQSNTFSTIYFGVPQKALKPVIAVLAVETPDGKVKLYRGTNMEVSMPTGSLCAERNVIGTALGKKKDAAGFTSCILLTQASISPYFCI